MNVNVNFGTLQNYDCNEMIEIIIITLLLIIFTILSYLFVIKYKYIITLI